MTFLDRETTRKAQQVRKNKRKFDTPDRPGTNLAYSMTGQGNGAQGSMAEALKAAGLAPAPKRRGKGKPKPKNRPQEARNPNAARMIRRMAGDA